MSKLKLTRRAGLATIAGGAFAVMTLSSAMAAPVTLDFWDMQWGGEDYAVAAQALVDKYNAENPDVHVQYRTVPWNNWYETFVTAVASGSAPDLSTGGSSQAVALYDQGAILPVDDLVARMDPKDFSPGTLEAMKYDGHYMALPWGIDIRVLFYNKKVLDDAGVAVPGTWAELQQAAEKVTGDGVYGLVSSGDTLGSQWIMLSTVNNGGGLFDESGAPNLTGERNMEALRFLSSFAQNGTLNPASAGYVGDDARGSFLRNEAAFLMYGPGLPDIAGDELRDNIGIAPPIKGPHGDVGTYFSINNVMVYKQTQHPEETLDFLEWWSENGLTLFSEGGTSNLPARADIAADEYFNRHENLKYVTDVYIPIAKPVSAQVGGTFPQLNAVDGDGFLTSLIQSIWQGKPIDGPVADAQAHFEEIMEE